MKRLRPNIQRSKRMVAAGVLASVAGLFLSLPAPATPPHAAGNMPSPPRWIRFEIEAINLCRAGMNQESSDPQEAIKTLRQAREESTAAITNGGGGNATVLHNDSVIGRALIMAEADAARTPENTENTKVTETQKSSGINPAWPARNHIQATISVRRIVR